MTNKNYAVVRNLAKINLAFGGKKNEKSHEERNENYLCLIEMIVEFDPQCKNIFDVLKPVKFMIIILYVTYKMN